MRPVRREIHDLALVHPKHAVDAAFDQQRQVRERTEAAVAQEHVADGE
jgi:hypothetical protein